MVGRNHNAIFNLFIKCALKIISAKSIKNLLLVEVLFNICKYNFSIKTSIDFRNTE